MNKKNLETQFERNLHQSPTLPNQNSFTYLERLITSLILGASQADITNYFDSPYVPIDTLYKSIKSLVN